MTTQEQQNREIVAAFIEAFWNRGEWECVDRFLSADFQELSYRSKEGLQQFAAAIAASFPDKYYTIEDLIANGDQVLVRMVVKGTHQGVFFGTAPTGNAIDVVLYRQYRVTDGQIAEHRGWIDMVTMWSQIRAS